MQEIKTKLAEFYNVCKEECFGLIEMNDDTRAKIKKLYGYQIKGSAFYNPFNIVFYELSDAQFFANILPRGCVLAQMTIPEFDTHLFIIRYSSDAVLGSILTLPKE